MIFFTHKILRLSQLRYSSLCKLTSKYSNLVQKFYFEDDYQIGQNIGQGSTARVYQSFDIVKNQKVILKLLKSIKQQKVIREIRILNALRQCPHIVPLINVIRNYGTGNYIMVFKYFPGVTLNYVQKTLSLHEIRNITKNILEGIKYMHDRNIMHRDMKASNILITNDKNQKKTAKIIDFGLSEFYKEGQNYNANIGTKCYKPPEILMKKNDYNMKIDIWGVGIILAEMLYKVKPILPHNPDDIQMLGSVIALCGNDYNYLTPALRSKLGNATKRSLSQQSISNLGTDIMYKMLNFSPNKRPTAQEALKHQFFCQDL